MDIDLITLIITIILAFNTIVIVPIAKILIYLVKRVSYLEGHLKIKD